VTNVPRFPTSLGASSPDTITPLGQDLAAGLMGTVGFGELALWLVTQRRPAPPQVRLFEAIGRVHPQVLGRILPLNGAGTCGAALADLGLPPALLRGFALLARTAGLLGHLAEEQRPPVGMDVYLTVEQHADYHPPNPA
jgi:hypothetical protein